MEKDKYDYLLKYIIIGDSGVGKSNIFLQFIKSTFKSSHEVTIGVEFGAKNIQLNNTTYRIQIWDTAGQETFKSITRVYYKNSACAFLVYDITNKDTFYNIQTWMNDCIAQTPQSVILVFVEDSADSVQKLYKAIDKIGVVCKFEYQKPIQIEKRIKGICNGYKVFIDDSTIRYFIEVCGTNMQDLINETRKLIEYAGPPLLYTLRTA
jgi:small GTP-binding protein